MFDKIPVIAFVLYTISLALPGVSFIDHNGHEGSVYGYFILLFGWFAMSQWSFAWFGNPLFLFSLFRSRHERPGIVLLTSLLALSFGVTGFLLEKVPHLDAPESTVTYFGLGYYLWLLSLALLVLYAFMRYRGRSKSETTATGAFDLRQTITHNTQAIVGLVVLLGMLVWILIVL